MSGRESSAGCCVNSANRQVVADFCTTRPHTAGPGLESVYYNLGSADMFQLSPRVGRVRPARRLKLCCCLRPSDLIFPNFRTHTPAGWL